MYIYDINATICKYKTVVKEMLKNVREIYTGDTMVLGPLWLFEKQTRVTKSPVDFK